MGPIDIMMLPQMSPKVLVGNCNTTKNTSNVEDHLQMKKIKKKIIKNGQELTEIFQITRTEREEICRDEKVAQICQKCQKVTQTARYRSKSTPKWFEFCTHKNDAIF